MFWSVFPSMQVNIYEVNQKLSLIPTGALLLTYMGKYNMTVNLQTESQINIILSNL